MSTDVRPAPSSGNVLDAVERRAWGIRLPTRRLFVVLAALTAAVVVVAALAAAWVAAENRATIADARREGLQVARAMATFSASIVAADADASGALIAGGIDVPAPEKDYSDHLRDASEALTDASAGARDEDVGEIDVLSEQLVTYTGLVETARANSRQGFPVGGSYLAQARRLAGDEMVPRSDRLRREGERRVAQAANDVAGVVGLVAVVLLLGAVAMVVWAAVTVAGRTRRMLHVGLLGAAPVAIASLGVVTVGIARQSSALSAAASDDVVAYIAANDASSRLSRMRVTEIAAVAARGGGTAQYDSFTTQADEFEGAFADTFAGTVDGYVDGVAEVRRTDEEDGDNRAAAAITLTGASFTGYEEASAAIVDRVDTEARDLGDQIDEAGAAGISPLVPLALGVLAAGLAVAGILDRGRRYR